MRRIVLLLLARPEYSFTRGRAVEPRQAQYYACEHYPDCRTTPLERCHPRDPIPLCREHNLPMNTEVVRRR